jgi:hypothetical protein
VGPLSATSAVPPSHELRTNGGAFFERTPPSGAAGSRTRVPRSRSSGLYVRRSWMISDTVLQGQAASVSTPSQGVPRSLDGRSTEVEPRDVDRIPLRGLRGRSSQSVKLREPSLRWRMWFPACFVEVTRASSARSHGNGQTTIETVSAPGLVGAHRRSAVLKPDRCGASDLTDRAHHRSASARSRGAFVPGRSWTDGAGRTVTRRHVAVHTPRVQRP